MSKEKDYLLSSLAVRERSRVLFEESLKGKTHFKVNLENLPALAETVAKVTRANYPTLAIPFHSRWGHFKVGGVDRTQKLNALLAGLAPLERARAKLDLAVVSVLLDAGAGMDWKYHCPFTSQTLSKSEGLAVASLDLFLKGAFSTDQKSPRADAQALAALKDSVIEQGFQVSPTNPLVGTAGRTQLLRKLGQTLTQQGLSRPGDLIDFWLKDHPDHQIEATEILKTVLLKFGAIWPGRIDFEGTPLGDAWKHPLLSDCTSDIIPFHKLSQWLSYSLMEPLIEFGFKIQNLDLMTGLPEYRNGGLFIDGKVIELRDPKHANATHAPDSLLVIEWRALTVTLLDLIAPQIRALLGQPLELVKILEGGTWHAGRSLAAQKRSDGGPPLKIQSDGTVF